MIAQWIEESKYRLTAQEKTAMKRELRRLNCLDWTLDIRMPKNKVEITVVIHCEKMIDMDATRRTRERYGPHSLIQVADVIRDAIKAEIDSIVMPHQVCYAERDLMTDYFGLYRIDYYWINFEVSADIQALINAKVAA